MRRPTNRTLAFLAAGAVAVGGAGAAIGVATSSSGRSPDAELADALNRNEGTHLTEADIRQAREDAFKARLDEAVKSGQLTQAQADAMLQRMKDAPARRAQHEAREAAWLGTVAKALGMSTAALRAELRSGKSLAQVAQEKGVARAKLLAAIKAAIATAAKAEGVTFSAARLNEMAARIADGRGGPGIDGFRGHHRGPGPWGLGGGPWMYGG